MIFLGDKLLEEWMLSLLVPFFKGKGDLLSPNSYRGTELVEHAFKLYEKVLDGRLCKLVEYDKIKYRFMPEKGSINAVFILRRLTEKFSSKKRSCLLCLLILKRLMIRYQETLFTLL